MKRFKKLRTLAAVMAALFMVQAIPFSAIAVGGEINDTIDHEAIIDQMHVDEAENAEAQAIVAEEIGMRSENEKHYRLEDGSYVAAQYPTAVHYKDENGNWADIDNTLSFEESKSDEDFDGYTNNENSFSVKLANDAKDQLLRLDDGEGTVFMKLSESAAESSEISVENADSTAAAQSELTVEEQNEAAMSLDTLTSKAEYADVMPGVDLEYTVMPDGVKEYIVVNEKLSDYEFSFELSLGDMYLRENDDNSISIMTADGEEKYIIPAPYMTDANDRYSDAVEYTVSDMGGGVYTLTVAADAGWIEDSETAFPVRIDPTITTSEKGPTIYNTYVSNASAYENVNFSSAQSIRVGYEKADTKTTRSYINWDGISSLPSSYVITSAKLRYYQMNSERERDTVIKVHKVLSEWRADTLTWNNQPAFDSNTINSVIVKNDTDDATNIIEFDVTEAIYDYCDGKDSFGIVLKEENETSSQDSFVVLSTPKDVTDTTSCPILEIYYGNQKGIDDDFSYLPINFGNDGTAYINTYNGDVIFVHDVFDLGFMKVNHVYNTYLSYIGDKPNNFDEYGCLYPNTMVGNCWSMSIMNTIFPTTEKEIENHSYITDSSDESATAYTYNDEYGAYIHLFEKRNEDGEIEYYEDSKGLGYKLFVNRKNYILDKFNDSSELIWEKEFKILKSSDAIQRDIGYITYYVDMSHEDTPVEYTYATRSSTKLNGMSVGDNSITFSVTNANKLQYIVIPKDEINNSPSRTIRFNYGTADTTSSDLISIVDSVKGTTTFEYNADKKLKTVTAADGSKLAFEYNNNDNRISSVKWSRLNKADVITTFEFAHGRTTVHYYGEDGIAYTPENSSTDDIVLNYLFDRTGNNTLAYAQNPKFGVYEKFAANGLKGIDCGAINDPDNNITLYMNDDVASGSTNFAMNTNLRYSNVKWSAYYDDSHTGGYSYRLESQTGTRTSNFVSKNIALQPGEHTFTAYVKCADLLDNTTKVNLSVNDDYYGDVIVDEKVEVQLSDCIGEWKKLTLNFSTYSELFETPEYIDYGMTDEAREFTLYISIDSTIAGNAVLVDDITIDDKILSFPTKINAVASSGFENGLSESNVRWETTNTSLNHIESIDESENVAFGNQSVMITGSTYREKSLHHIAYMNYTTDETKYRLSGWGKASSLPLKDDSSNGFELFAYYIYYVATQTGTYNDGTPKYTRGEMKTVSTAIPFDDQYDDWQYVSAELKAPKETLKETLEDNQVIQIYSITIGVLYKNNTGNAYFDNIELTPVQ